MVANAGFQAWEGLPMASPYTVLLVDGDPDAREITAHVLPGLYAHHAAD
jgi:hypothetical protein